MTENSPPSTMPVQLGLLGTLPQWEFVGLVASMMALNALAIDIMLPALGLIAGEFGVSGNKQQWIIFAYVFGFGAPQLIFGPLSDRFGRKGLALICLVGYAVTSLACVFTSSFEMLLAARFYQGIAAAGIRVIGVSIVRDLMAGRSMAKVMSLVMTVFMIVPIIAPALGQGIMVFAPWQAIMLALMFFSALLFVWIFFRLPETLPPQRREKLSFVQALSAYRQVLRHRVTLGYMAASGIIFGALFAFISASEQIFAEVFDKSAYFSILFAGVAGLLAVANFTNSKIVERFGMRRISHTVLLIFIALFAINAIVMSLMDEPFWVFYPLFMLGFGCFGMMGANFSAIAMEPQGRNTGTASAAYGFATTTVAGFFGWLVASQYNGSVIPILMGFAGLGIASLVIVLITERGRLFERSR